MLALKRYSIPTDRQSGDVTVSTRRPHEHMRCRMQQALSTAWSTKLACKPADCKLRQKSCSQSGTVLAQYSWCCCQSELLSADRVQLNFSVSLHNAADLLLASQSIKVKNQNPPAVYLSTKCLTAPAKLARPLLARISAANLGPTPSSYRRATALSLSSSGRLSFTTSLASPIPAMLNLQKYKFNRLVTPRMLTIAVACK